MNFRLYGILAFLALLLVGSGAEKSAKCLDEHPTGVGMCRMLIFGFYYEKESNSCEQYRTGGCNTEGGTNSFNTLEDCAKECVDY